MLTKRFGVYVNDRLMTRTVTLLKAKRLAAEYQAKGLRASVAELIGGAL